MMYPVMFMANSSLVKSEHLDVMRLADFDQSRVVSYGAPLVNV